MRITDELLYQYAPEARNIVLATFPSDEEIPQYQTSKKFNKIIDRLLKEQKRSPKLNKTILYLKRAAVIALAAITIAFSGCMAFEEFREKVVEVVVTVFHELTDYKFYVSPSVNSSEIEEKLPEIELSYIPEGFECTKKNIYPSMVSYYFYDKNNSEAYFKLVQRTLSVNGDYGLILDTENATTYTIYINGNEAIANTKSNLNTLVWNNNNIYYKLYGPIPMEELINIAENIIEKI